MHSILFYVFHNAPDHNLFVVAESIHVDFVCILEKLVDENRTLTRNLDRGGHIVIEHRFVIDNNHGTSAKHIGRTNENGIPDLTGDAPRFFQGDRGPVLGLRDVQLPKQVAKSLAIFREVDGFRRGPNDGYARGLQIEREVQRSLSTELHDHAIRFLFSDNVENVFQRERLEVKTIRCVVIRRYGFRIAVDHDGFVALFLESKRRMATAIIELDSLPDPVRAAAEDDDLLPIAWRRFVFLFVRGIKVWGVGLELCRARVDALIYRYDAEVATLGRDITRFRVH